MTARFALSLAALLLSSSASATVYTLQNDQYPDPPGEIEAVAVCGFLTAEKFAVLLSPPAGSYPYRLRSLEIFAAAVRDMNGACTPLDENRGDIGYYQFRLDLYADSGNLGDDPEGSPILTLPELTGELNGNTFGSIDLTSSNSEIESDVMLFQGDVRAVFTITQTDGRPVRDLDGISSGRNKIYAAQLDKWTDAALLGVNGDFLVRMKVSSNVSPNGNDAGPSAGSDAGSGGNGGGSDAGSGGSGTGQDAQNVCDRTCQDNGFMGGVLRDEECKCLHRIDGQDQGCGCANTGAAASLWLSLLALLALRRRKELVRRRS
jgi:MYXO-CTERM domain-containing protein